MSPHNKPCSSWRIIPILKQLGPVRRTLACLCLVTLIGSILMACNAQHIAEYLETSDLLLSVSKSPTSQAVNAAPSNEDGAADHQSSDSSGSSASTPSDADSQSAVDAPASSDSTALQTEGSSSAEASSSTSETQTPPVSQRTDATTQTDPSSTSPQQESNLITIHLLIECSKAVDAGWSGSSQMYAGDISVEKGTSALEATKQVARLSVRQTQFGPYVEAINSLAEKQYGGMSGWMYSVNGNYPNFGCHKYILKNNDRLTWTYVTGK